MGIRRDARRNGLNRYGVGRLREIHGEARAWLTLRGSLGCHGLRIFEFLAAIAAGYFSQTFGSGILFGVDGRIGRLVGRGGRIIFLDARAILLGKNLRLLQIFVGVNVRVFFLLRGLAGFFLAGGVGDLL
jgi:hypothetical protein